MPTSAPRPCTKPGCKRLAYAGSRCDLHPYERQRTDAGKRAGALYNSRPWRKARAAFLNSHPLCAECERNNKVKAASIVDHIEPHQGNIKLFWNPNNWQPLCKSCHDSKTARQDGGFGLTRGGRV